MILDREKIRFGITDVIIVIVSAVLLAGSCTWFKTCAVGETVMSCHWAGEAVKALAILMAVLSIVHVFLPDHKLKAGMDIASAGIAFVIMRIPGPIINVCGNADMTCRKVTQPWVTVCGVLLIVAVAADIVFYMAKMSNDKHKRCNK